MLPEPTRTGQVVDNAAACFTERPRRSGVLDGGERNTDDEEREVGQRKVQQEDTAPTVTQNLPFLPPSGGRDRRQ